MKDASPFAFARNLVVVASAGTGKTHCLVGVMVHLLLGATEEGGALRPALDPTRVLATTFSRRAAAEIRARLTEALTRLAGTSGDAPYRADLRAACERVGANPWSDGEIRARASRALADVARVQVGTLHSFAASVVRRHALELGLSPGFELVDEAETQERTRAAIVRVLGAHADKGDGAVQALAVAAGGVETLVEQTARMLERLSEDGRGASALTLPGDEDVHAIERSFEQLIAHARALTTDPVLGSAARAFLAAEARGDGDGVLEAAASICGIAARGDKSDAAAAFFAFRAGLGGTTNAARGHNLVRAWRARHRAVAQGSAARDFLQECQSELHRAARSDSVLGFGDVLLAARDLLRDHPVIAAEAGGTLDALLVDEFQDTSRVQKEIVHLLWDGAPLARVAGTVPGLGKLRERGLLIVGDRKQSIYAFRGADVALFAEVAVGLAGRQAREALGLAAGVVWEPETPRADFHALRENWRARAPLLTFANAYGRCWLRPAGPVPALYEITYVPKTEDLVPAPGRAGGAAGAGATWLRVPRREGVAGAAAARRDEAAVIARWVQDVVCVGAPRVRGAPPRWRDFAVLARTHEMLDAAADALARANVPHVVAGQGFYSAREVRDLASMLALLLDPGDKLALLEVLRGPWVSVRDDTLIGLTDPGRGLAELGPAWDAGERRDLIHADDREPLRELRGVVEALRGLVDRIGPARVLREAARALGFEETLILLPRGQQRVANVEKLLALADDEPDGRALLARLDRAAAREHAEEQAAMFTEDDDAVRLLTVHASKGLDFPIVFLPEVGKEARLRERGLFALNRGDAGERDTLSVRFVDDDGFVHEPPSYVEARSAAARRDAAERARLAYVAATRASEAMFFVGDLARARANPPSPTARTVADVLHELTKDEAARQAAALEIIDVAPLG